MTTSPVGASAMGQNFCAGVRKRSRNSAPWSKSGRPMWLDSGQKIQDRRANRREQTTASESRTRKLAQSRSFPATHSRIRLHEFWLHSTASRAPDGFAKKLVFA